MVASHQGKSRGHVGRGCELPAHVSLVARSQNAEAEVKRLQKEVRVCREQLGHHLQQERETGMLLPPGGVAALHELLLERNVELENLKEELDSVIGRLQATRELVKFKDRRIAELEVKVMDSWR